MWVSTAIHHFVDLAAAIAEFRRILIKDGHVILRGYVPGHTPLPWLELFPGHEKARSRFPSLAALNQAFAEAGLALQQACVVPEFSWTAGKRADFCVRMRHADSILTALEDEEVAAGIAALRERADQVENFALSCLVYS